MYFVNSGRDREDGAARTTSFKANMIFDLLGLEAGEAADGEAVACLVA